MYLWCSNSLTMNQTLGILFYLKTSKKLANGEVPIYLHITIDGKRAEHSIQRSFTRIAGVVKAAGLRAIRKSSNPSISF